MESINATVGILQKKEKSFIKSLMVPYAMDNFKKELAHY
jgi:hypothetical protein